MVTLCFLVTIYFYKVFCHSHYIFCGMFIGISKEKSYFQKFGKHDFGKTNW